MKSFRLKKTFLIIFSVFLFTCIGYAQTDSSSKDSTSVEEELPQSLKDLRRFEIITLGSMPFVTLDTTLVYSGIKSVSTGVPFNPFGASNYTQKEQFGIILTSLGISVGIGLFDYIFNLIKRKSEDKKAEKIVTSYINVIPISEDTEAIKLNEPEEEAAE